MRPPLSPELLAGLGTLRLRAECLLNGTLAGMHRSPFQGFSAEFDQYRGYSPGDDPRFFDWRIYGRTGHAVVKRFRDETNATLYLVLDTSASMGYSGGGPFSKLEIAGLLASALATLGYRQRDALSLLSGSEGLDNELPPGAGGSHFQELLRRIAILKPTGQTDLKSLLTLVAQRIKSASMTLIFTDLWQEGEALMQGLRQIRSKNQAVSLIHLTTQAEQNLLATGDIVYRDLETRATLKLMPEAFREQYQRDVKQHHQGIRAACQNLGIRFHTLDLASPLDIALRAIIRDFGIRPGR
jgi:uncharacterized protein (DUF58 family)